MQTEKKELKITISYQPISTLDLEKMFSLGVKPDNRQYADPEKVAINGFKCSISYLACSIKGTGIDAISYDFYIGIGEELNIIPNIILGANSPLEMKREGKEVFFYFADDFKPIAQAIQGYRLTKKESKNLKGFLEYPGQPEIEQEALEYFANLIKRILEAAGYSIVEVKEHYFPAPTSMAYVSPAFSIGLQKDAKPIDIKEGYETEYIYLSLNKPQSKSQIQLRVFDSIPEERLKELQRSLKDNLSPYGLKCLYLAIEECGYNKRNPWFILDTNRCLDLMGHKRDKRGIHYSRRKKRLLSEFEALTRINFNIERREPKTKKNKDKAFKFTAPLLSITGKFEEWEVESGKPLESGKKIKENVQIFLHPEIYKYVNNWYTVIPKDFLKIDVRSRPHAILLYSYIANQWRIGWSQYQGTIKQPMRQLLEGAGLLDRLPKRSNQQRDFIDRIKDDLSWLKSQKQFWIKSVRIESKNMPFLSETVIIRMADDHPLTRIKKQIAQNQEKLF